MVVLVPICKYRKNAIAANRSFSDTDIIALQILVFRRCLVQFSEKHQKTKIRRENGKHEHGTHGSLAAKLRLLL